MPSKIKVLLKTILKYWFIYLVIFIAIVAIYQRTYAMWITIIAIIVILLSFIPRIYLRIKLIRFMKKYYRIDDRTVARLLKKPLRKIQNKMYFLTHENESFLVRLIRKLISKIYKNPNKKKWLIVFFNKQYIFYHVETIEKLKEFYLKGYNHKELLEELKEYEIETREEIKTIIDTLIRNQRISDKEITVKERQEKKRFENI